VQKKSSKIFFGNAASGRNADVCAAQRTAGFDGVALLRVIDAQYSDHGIPDQIAFDVVVWIKLHKT
jgi:hypothetical protein